MSRINTRSKNQGPPDSNNDTASNDSDSNDSDSIDTVELCNRIRNDNKEKTKRDTVAARSTLTLTSDEEGDEDEDEDTTSIPDRPSTQLVNPYNNKKATTKPQSHAAKVTPVKKKQEAPKTQSVLLRRGHLVTATT
jgi:hypothetical protein